MNINPYKSKARYVAVSGIMLALAVALTTIESMVSAFLPIGVRIGLANIVVLTAMVCINLPTAFIITVLKSAFVLITRGVSAGMMSLCGGIFAFAITAILLAKVEGSFVSVSIAGAIAHTMGQLCMAAALTESAYTFYYAPLLIVAATVSGVVTGFAAGAIIPQFNRISRRNQ